MRHLFAWVISFSRQDRIVNQAVHQLGEIARQKTSLSASMTNAEQLRGYRQARLRRDVREYLATLERGQRRPLNPSRQNVLAEAILQRISGQPWGMQTAPATVECSPRKAA